jgi:NADPH:quinone reductase-like Zn-dependent oxidoreductase
VAEAERVWPKLQPATQDDRGHVLVVDVEPAQQPGVLRPAYRVVFGGRHQRVFEGGRDQLEDAAGQADLVFDTIGGEVLARSPALLRPGGTLVSVAAPPPASRDDIREVAFVQESNRAQLIELARRVDQGHLRPQVGAVYPLAEAAKAYSAKAAGGIPGRIILQP